MEKFKTLKSIPAHMPLLNIDTDMIIPKQFLKTIKRSGLGKNLFDEMRYDSNGNEIDTFILNKEPFRNAKILIAGKNFGCGSSREHAPWSILDFGIKVIIAPSFADIFFNNSFKNGILPIKMDEDIINSIIDESMQGDHLEINLVDQEIILKNRKINFDVDSVNKDCLIKGLDDISSTLEKSSYIDEFEIENANKRPWNIPS